MLSPQLRNQIVEMVATEGCYLSLHTADPGANGTAELTGGRYVRHRLGTMPAAKDGFKATDREITLLDLPKCRVTHVGLWDAEKGGAFRAGCALGKPIDVTEGDSVRFKAAKLAFAISDKDE